MRVTLEYKEKYVNFNVKINIKVEGVAIKDFEEMRKNI